VLSNTAAQTVHENRIYTLRMICDETYPDKPPVVHFVSKVNLPCVNVSNGKVGHPYVGKMCSPTPCGKLGGAKQAQRTCELEAQLHP